MKLAPVALVLAAVATVGGCGQDAISVAPPGGADYNHGKLLTAIDGFVAAGRTAPAFAALVTEVRGLRTGMDETVAEEAERKLAVLALAPMESAMTLAKPLQVDALALTVWPYALGPGLGARTPDGRFDARAEQLLVRAGETPDQYLIRLCGEVIPLECREAVPEYHGAIIGALAIHRFTERARNSISGCLVCASDPAWDEAVARWERLDQTASRLAQTDRNRARPMNWPTAGAASVPWGDGLVATGTVIELELDGDVQIDGELVELRERVTRLAALSALPPTQRAAVRVAPTATWSLLAPLLADAARAGIARLPLIARAPTFPWQTKVYEIPTASRVAVARPTDTIQVVLRALDARVALNAPVNASGAADSHP